MAQPFRFSLWLRLFGPDGPTTIAEFREAIRNADFGQLFGDGGFITRIRDLIASQNGLPARPDPHAIDGNTGALVRGSDTTYLLDLRLPAIPGAVVAGTESAAAAGTVGDPQHAPTPGGRVATLFVNADPWVASGLIPIEYGAANKDAPLHDATRDNPFSNSWLATWLALQQTQMQIGWDADSLGDAADGLGLLLGPVAGSVVLSGDFSAGFMLTPQSLTLEQVTLAGGSDYNLATVADSVGAGQSLVIDAQALGAGDHAIFDGSAVTAGSFTFLGGAGTDTFTGGGGDDMVRGGAGADTLAGGGGRDTFVYLSASNSTGPAYDVLADFNPAQDKIDLPGTVTGFDAAVQTGTLSAGSFNADLVAALAGLGAGHAMVYTPDAGDLAGQTFLVVDANGIAGYQAGQDYVFALPATTPADLSAHPDFFI